MPWRVCGPHVAVQEDWRAVGLRPEMGGTSEDWIIEGRLGMCEARMRFGGQRRCLKWDAAQMWFE